MKFRNCIIAFFLLMSSLGFSQTSFTNIDTLLFKVFQTVNLNDSFKYINLVNQAPFFSEKKMYNKKDSLLILNPFFESFSNFRESISDFVFSKEFMISYNEYETVSGKQIDKSIKSKIPLIVKLIVNESFAIRCLFIVLADHGLYTVEDPLIRKFLEN